MTLSPSHYHRQVWKPKQIGTSGVLRQHHVQVGQFRDGKQIQHFPFFTCAHPSEAFTFCEEFLLKLNNAGLELVGVSIV